MSEHATCWTNPHVEQDLLMRVRLLEMQLAAVADAVRRLTEVVDDEHAKTEVAKQVAGLLDGVHVPHL